jgi:hypothetical protein
MYAALPAKQIAPGRLSIQCRPRPLLLDYDVDKIKATIDAVPIEDDKLRDGWGDRLYRMAFELDNTEPAGRYEFRFHAGTR